tara:strand:- start:672 stop:1694 length:1023 start_codon:yes stop_codon:yes gene_type:complete
MDFRSDNTASIHPRLLESVLKVNQKNSSSYGADEYSQTLKDTLSDHFGCDLDIVLASTGTAANCIALRTFCPSFGSVLTTEESHLNNDEGQAPELFLSGGKVKTFSTSDKKLDLLKATNWIHKAKRMTPHAGKPACVSITYATEWGDLYSLQELREIRSFCDEHKLLLHVDGARFANAICSAQLTPKEFYNILKPDALSLGLTKNGALQAEVVVLFNLKYKDDLRYVHKQAGQLLSKTRFFSAQILEILKDDLWLELASHANERASELKKIFDKTNRFKVINSGKTNQLFIEMDKKSKDILEKNNCLFYHWQDNTYRFVTSWMTTKDDIKNFSKLLTSLK